MISTLRQLANQKMKQRRLNYEIVYKKEKEIKSLFRVNLKWKIFRNEGRAYPIAKIQNIDSVSLMKELQ